MNALRRLNTFMGSPAPWWVVRLLVAMLAVELAALALLTLAALAGGAP